jgi:CBS domain-containing protein
MAAVFGAASRATFAFIVFAFEITHDYNAILPLMLACVIADLIAIHYLPTSIMTEKLSRRGLDVPGDYEAAVLEMVKVGDVMRLDVPTIPQGMTVTELAERMGRGEPEFQLTQGLPIVSPDGALAGVVTQSDLLRALRSNDGGKLTVLEAGSQPAIVAYPDESALTALMRMLQKDVGRLPVVERDNSGRVVGFVNRSSILSAYTRRMEEEGVREHGWLHNWMTR